MKGLYLIVLSHFIRVLFGFFGRLEVVRRDIFWFSFKNYIKFQIIGKDLFILALIVTVLFGSLEFFLGYLFLCTTLLKCVSKAGYCLTVHVTICKP